LNQDETKTSQNERHISRTQNYGDKWSGRGDLNCRHTLLIFSRKPAIPSDFRDFMNGNIVCLMNQDERWRVYFG